MQHTRKRAGLLKSALLGAATLGALSLAGAGFAQAAALTGTVNVTGYNYTCSGCTSSSTSQQALYSTIADVTGGTDSQVSGLTSESGTYTGPLDFNPTTATIGGFFSSNGVGSTTGFTSTFLSKTLSSSGFNITTLLDIKITPSTDITSGSILHDDGISLYAATDTSTDLISGSAPTTSSPTSFPTLSAATTYDLIYVEANGLPAVLRVTGSGNLSSVPEPGSLALLGTGLLGLGLVARRRRRKA